MLLIFAGLFFLKIASSDSKYNLTTKGHFHTPISIIGWLVVLFRESRGGKLSMVGKIVLVPESKNCTLYLARSDTPAFQLPKSKM